MQHTAQSGLQFGTVSPDLVCNSTAKCAKRMAEATVNKIKEDENATQFRNANSEEHQAQCIPSSKKVKILNWCTCTIFDKHGH